MSETLSSIVQRTITRLSMVAGVAVQVYAEDRIAEMVWHKFVVVRDELWWDEYMDYATLTQDANGRPIENVVREKPATPDGTEIIINKYNDIQYAWAPTRRGPLKEMPQRQNPMGMLRSGTTMYRLPDPVSVIRFAMFTPGLQCAVRYRRHYTRFRATDVVPMDDQVLILGAAYDYLEDDGTNPGQTEKFRAAFLDRLRQLKSAENEREIVLSPAPTSNDSGWQTVA